MKFVCPGFTTGIYSVAPVRERGLKCPEKKYDNMVMTVAPVRERGLKSRLNKL